MKIQVVIPSRGRYQCRKALAMFTDPLLCVGEDEAEPYKKANPKTRLLVHPADLVGMGRKRQWILDHVQEKVVFMCDDDVTGCWSVVGMRARQIFNPDSIMRILENAAEIADGIGTCLFGFSHTVDTRHFQSFRPFAFTGYINGFAMGIIGRTVKFDELLDTKQDIDFSLQVLLKYRILWRDSRFAFRNANWFRRVGGMAGIRSAATVERDLKRLKKKWGKAVDIDHFHRTGKGKHQNVRIHVDR